MTSQLDHGSLPEPDSPPSRAQTLKMVRRVLAGDSQAGTELVHHSGGRVLAMVMFYMGRSIRRRFDPEDLAQEVWMEIFRALQLGKGPTVSFGAWVRTIVRRRLARLASRSRPFPASASDLDPGGNEEGGWQPTSEGTLPLVRSYRREAIARLVEVVESLPERHQKVWTRYWFEEQKVRQIAEQLNLSSQRVREELRRANRAVRRHFQGEPSTDPGDWSRRR